VSLPPPDIEQSISKSIWRFLWLGRRAGPVARANCLAPKHLGGLGMFDFSTVIDSLLISTLRRLVDHSDSKWKDLIAAEFRASEFCKSWGHGLGAIVAAASLKSTTSNISPYWIRAINSAQRLHLHELPPTTPEHVMRQPIFYNQAITEPNGQPLGDKSLHKVFTAGIQLVGHLIDADDNFRQLTHHELGIRSTAHDRIFPAIPKDWWHILERGFDSPRVGEWFLDTRQLPAPHMLRISSVNTATDTVSCTIHPLSLEAITIPSPNLDTADFSRSSFPLIRAHVQPHWRGHLCIGPADISEIDENRLVIDQLLGSKIVQQPLLQSTMRGTTYALTASMHKLREFNQL
jgi:hypothetical protein